MENNKNPPTTLDPLIKALMANGTGELQVTWRKNFSFINKNDGKVPSHLDQYDTSLYHHNRDEPDEKEKVIPAKIAFSYGLLNFGFVEVTIENFSVSNGEFGYRTICCIPLDGKDVPDGTDGPFDDGDNASELYLHFFMPEDQEGYWEHGGTAIIFLVDRKSDLIFREE